MFKFSKKFLSLIMAILMLSMTAIGVNAEELIVGTTDLLVDIGIIDPSPEEELMPMAANGCISFPDYPGNDPTVSPGTGWEWRGPSETGSWYNPSTGESLHPDLNHETHGPHWDYIPYKNGPQYRIYPDGRVVLKSEDDT